MDSNYKFSSLPTPILGREGGVWEVRSMRGRLSY